MTNQEFPRDESIEEKLHRQEREAAAALACALQESKDALLEQAKAQGRYIRHLEERLRMDANTVTAVANSETNWKFVETPESVNARQQDLVASLIAERDSLLRANHTFRLDRQHRSNERDQLRAALKTVEWDGLSIGNMEAVCPSCDETEKHGHAPDCIVGLALEGGGGKREG